jgi:GNAT superfamily N-acetyltransferase
MQEILPDGGVIRKLWLGEHTKYRDHLLRLDTASRHSRFGGGVSDDFIRNFVDLSLSLDAVVHGFFVDGMMRGAAELRQLSARLPGQAEAAISVEKPWQSHGVGSALLRRTLLAARNRGYRNCTWLASPRTGACSSSPANSTPSSPSTSAASWAKSYPGAPTRCRSCRN